MIRSGRQSDDTMWLRIPVSIVVSGFLFVFMGPVAGIAWLSAVLAAEGASWVVLARLIRSGGAWRLVNLMSVWAISTCWIVVSVMLWWTGHDIARMATIVTLLTAAVHGVTSAYMNRSLLLALIGPQLVTLGVILIAHAWSAQEAPAAIVTTAATLGACAIVALNGVTLNRTDMQLVQSNADLTALNARVTELAHQAEARSETRTELLADVSHELRTPLNGVLASAQQLAASPLNPEQRRLVQIMLASGKTLDRLSEDLLDLSAIEAGRLSLKPSPVDLGHLVESIADQHRSAIEARGLALKIEIDHVTEAPVLLDAVRLQQVLGNLIANASKYTTEGSVSVKVRALEHPDKGSWAEIVVEDTGPGLGTTDTEGLFSRFNRGGEDQKTQPGLGLGLTIARTLADSMGGSLRAEPRAIGSAFAFALPLVPAEMNAPADEPTARPTTGLRVLVADDHEINRNVLTVILEALGASVATVPDGAIAVREFSIEPFDLVILDMIMPGMDGLAAAREMRIVEEMARSNRTPIVMLTAMHTREAEAASLAAGCDIMLTKPVAPAKLAEAISKLTTSSAH